MRGRRVPRSSERVHIPFGDDCALIRPVAGTALFGLVPIARGTAQREGLRGYLVRLACEHQVRPRDLIARVLGPSSQFVAQLDYARFYSRYAQPIDGLGWYARLFSSALNEATGRNDLQQLTLLPWSELLAPQGQTLLASHPQWCPECLAQGLVNGIVWWQLRWSIAQFGWCPDHHVALMSRCPACGRPQPAVPRAPTLVHCDHCGCLLVESEASGSRAPPHEDERSTMAALVSDLVDCQDRMDGEPLSRWKSFLLEQVAALPDHRRAALCRHVGLPARGLQGWLGKGKRVAMHSLLAVCLALGASPASIFADPQPRSMRRACLAAGRVKANTRPRPRHSLAVRTAALHQLSEALHCAGMPPTLRELARTRGVSRAYLVYWFPAQCRAISARRKAVLAENRRVALEERTALIREAVKSLVQQGRFPGRKHVEAAVLAKGFSLRDPGYIDVYRDAIAISDDRRK